MAKRRHWAAPAPAQPARGPRTEVHSGHWTCISDALSAILVSNRLTKLLARRASCPTPENAVSLVPRSNHGLPVAVKCLWLAVDNGGLLPPSASSPRSTGCTEPGSCLPSSNPRAQPVQLRTRSSRGVAVVQDMTTSLIRR